MGTRESDEKRRNESGTTNRRSFLRSTAMALGGLSLGAGVSGSASGQARPGVGFHGESSRGGTGSPSSRKEMHIDVITVPDTNSPEVLYDAMESGLDQLYDQLGSWFSGYHLRKYELNVDVDCNDRVSSVADALDDAYTHPEMSDGFDDPNRLYHFANPCLFPDNDTYSPRRSGPNPPWGTANSGGKRPISSIGDKNAVFNHPGTSNNYQVRALHQALHMFIDGELAVQVAEHTEDGDDDALEYDAQHTLGTIDSQNRRTVMADLSTSPDHVFPKDGYKDEAADGTCGGDPGFLRDSTWPDMDDLVFSECTKQALELSAKRHGLGQTVGLPAVGDRENPPTDPDDDGLYEDLSGNGEKDPADVVTLFQNSDTDEVTDYSWAYDFSGNGGIDPADTVELYDEI